MSNITLIVNTVALWVIVVFSNIRMQTVHQKQKRHG